MTEQIASMRRFSLRFEDAALEAEFAEDQAQKLLRPLRVLAICVLVFVGVSWAFAPGLIAVENPHARFTLPAILGMSSMVLIYALSYRRGFLAHMQRVTLALACLFSILVIGVLTPTPRIVLAASGFILPVIHTYGIYTVLRLRFPVAIFAAMFMAAIYLAFLIWHVEPTPFNVGRHIFYLGTANLFGMFAAYQMNLFARREFASMHALAAERERSERLLLNILPVPIAERLKASEAAIADHSDAVTILFADIVGFTSLSARKTPQDLVTLLDRMFSEFDVLAEEHGLEKIKTVGDAYMAVSGLPQPRTDHAQAAARMAQGILEAVARVAVETGENLAVRIGLNSGPVVAGVIGRKKFSYDMWGDTVNTASRMESHGLPGTIQCSEATAALLRPDFPLSARGAMQIKGKGEMQTFILAND